MSETNKVLNFVDFKQLWAPGLLALVFDIAALFCDNSLILIISADLLLVFYIAWKLKNPVASGVMVFLIALIVAVAKLIIHWEFIYFFAIITEPIVYGLSASVLAVIINLIINKFITKGGEIDGRKESRSTD
jgi:hypothetical protein